jgi:hypothetical protein
MIRSREYNAIEEAKTYYKKQGWDFQKDVRFFLKNGYVFAGPEFFLMGRRVRNSWFVQMAAGKNVMQVFMKLMPYRLPYIQWYRFHKDRKLRCYKTEDLERIIYDRRNSS